MTDHRHIRKVLTSRPTIEGAGVHLRRAIGFAEPQLYDPFLLLDDFRSDTPSDYLAGFPWHPHRGIETITYVLAGTVDHADSTGNGGQIGAGDIQWMTAGSGILHQEMPQGDAAGRMHGFQLWANLPAAHKMMEPRYQGLTAAEIPAVTDGDGNTIKVICGQVDDTRGPVKDIMTDPSYLDVALMPGRTWVHRTPRGHTVFAYVIQGRGRFSPEDDPYGYEAQGTNYFDMQRSPWIANRQLVLYGDGDTVTVNAAGEGVRFLLISGQPIREPIAWYGPIVMNTQEELRTAFEELQRGTFIKSR